MAMYCATAPVNIALVKYWVKADYGAGSVNHPATPSLSMCLHTVRDVTHEHLCAAGAQSEPWALLTRTTLSLRKDIAEHTIAINGVEVCATRRQLETFSAISPDGRFHVESTNHFPTAAGLASSASGGAALGMCLAALMFDTARSGRPPPVIYDTFKCLDVCAGQYDELDQMGAARMYARKLSGSAVRSIGGGFVLWEPIFADSREHRVGEFPCVNDSLTMASLEGEIGVSSRWTAGSRVTQLHGHSHWPSLRCVVIVASAAQKEVSSTEGMKRTAATSGLWPARVNQATKNCQAAMGAIRTRDFQGLAPVVMRESNALHALCMDTWPPLEYLTDASRAVMRAVREINAAAGSYVAAYTFDAGPNAFVLCEGDDGVARVLERVVPCVPDPVRVLVCSVGPGASLM